MEEPSSASVLEGVRIRALLIERQNTLVERALTFVENLPGAEPIEKEQRHYFLHNVVIECTDQLVLIGRLVDGRDHAPEIKFDLVRKMTTSEMHRGGKENHVLNDIVFFATMLAASEIHFDTPLDGVGVWVLHAQLHWNL